MRTGRCISLRGGDQESRLACAMAIARACTDAGNAAVSYAGVWNSTGDPDPYNSYPFSSLTLIAPEARLTYRRPGTDPAGYLAFSDIDAEIVIVDLPGHDFPWLALEASSLGAGCLATWGFDSEGFPRLDGLAAPVLSHLLSRLLPGGSCTTGCSGGCSEGTRLWVGEKRIPLSGYPGRVLEEVVTAIVGTLRGTEGDGAIRIEITRDR